MLSKVGVIGGTGVYDPESFGASEELTVGTPYGDATLFRCSMGETEVYFLPRHGSGHSIAPHLINYRANILALRQVGVRRAIATSAVGSLNPARGPGSFGILTQFLDFTHSRPFTFADTLEKGVRHLDFTNPYCSQLRDDIAAAAHDVTLPIADDGCYVCAEGPRYETAAEIRAFRLLGGDYVGMTGCPEVVLAREAGLCYSSIAIVANLGAGMTESPLSHEEVVAIVRESGRKIQQLIVGTIRRMSHDKYCDCPDQGPAV